jgi:hypothetical protein
MFWKTQMIVGPNLASDGKPFFFNRFYFFSKILRIFLIFLQNNFEFLEVLMNIGPELSQWRQICLRKLAEAGSKIHSFPKPSKI